MGRVCSSCGEGVVRASAVSELTERVTFFFFQSRTSPLKQKNSSDVERLTEGTVLDTNQRSEAGTDGHVEKTLDGQTSVIDTLVLQTRNSDLYRYELAKLGFVLRHLSS